MISRDEFLSLSTEEVARLVRGSGSKVCVFPINGTRRWFMLEYGEREFEDPIAAYMDLAMRRHVELYKLFFDHGVETLVTPVIGPEILATRGGYMRKIGGDGLARLATHPDLLSFYEAYGVRVRFYGDYRQHLAGTPYEFLTGLFDDVAERTRSHDRFRLFFGAFADNLNSTARIAELAVEHFKEHGAVPDRKKLVELYYGETIERADIFIGFDRLAVFDYPLINSGEEDLYFMVAPSSYLTERQLRAILYDHLYTRRTLEPDFADLPPEAYANLRAFYRAHQDSILGTGQIRDGYWQPEIIEKGQG